MRASVVIELARPGDARALAEMSRDLIEMGLPWGWRPPRVLAMIQHPDDVVVLVARSKAERTGFAVMEFHERYAHLNLLAVIPNQRRQRTGAALLDWLEASARVAGIERIILEVRRNNSGARAFYRSRQYEEVVTLPGYYRGREHAVRMRHQLIAPEVAAQRPG